jgi:hypothetical protein
MDSLIALKSEVRFSRKYRLLQAALQAEESISALFRCVLEDSWTCSSRYDWLLGEDSVAALVLQALCAKLQGKELADVVSRLCECSQKPQAKELWTVFTLQNPFSSPFMTLSLLESVATAWQARLQLWNEEK